MQSYYYCIVIKLDKSTLRNKLLKQLNVSKVCVCVCACHDHELRKSAGGLL